MVHEHERDERPFDPEANYPREVSPHHFAVNAGAEYARQHLILPQEYIEELALWHGGQDSATYRLLSIGMRGYVSQSMVEDAVDELEQTKAPRGQKKALEDLVSNLWSVQQNPSEYSVEESGVETPAEWEYDELYEGDDGEEMDESGVFVANRCPVGTEVETLIFSKDDFTRAQAKAWARRNSYRYGKVDETDDSYRLRQQDPDDFRRGSFRTIVFTDGVEAVIACPK